MDRKEGQVDIQTQPGQLVQPDEHQVNACQTRTREVCGSVPERTTQPGWRSLGQTRVLGRPGQVRGTSRGQGRPKHQNSAPAIEIIGRKVKYVAFSRF